MFGGSGENYSRETLAIGLRRKLGADFVDYPKIDCLYDTSSMVGRSGHGFSYGGLLPDIKINRGNISIRILLHEFDVIVYGRAGFMEGEPVGNLYKIPVPINYRPRDIAFVYGGDGLQDTKDTTNSWTQHLALHCNRGLCFVRELA
jgi:hypothetical protein